MKHLALSLADNPLLGTDTTSCMPRTDIVLSGQGFQVTSLSEPLLLWARTSSVGRRATAQVVPGMAAMMALARHADEDSSSAVITNKSTASLAMVAVSFVYMG